MSIFGFKTKTEERVDKIEAELAEFPPKKDLKEIIGAYIFIKTKLTLAAAGLGLFFFNNPDVLVSILEVIKGVK